MKVDLGGILKMSFEGPTCFMTWRHLGSGEPRIAVVNDKTVKFASLDAFERGLELFKRTIGTTTTKVVNTKPIADLPGLRVVETEEVIQQTTIPTILGLKTIGSSGLETVFIVSELVESELCTTGNCECLKKIFGDDLAEMLTEAITSLRAGHA